VDIIKVKRYLSLFEMAYSKSKIEQQIINAQPRILEHIVKLLLYPKQKQYHNDWIVSIYKQLINISDMKWESNNWYLKKENYFKYFFTAPLMNQDNYNYLDKMLNRVIADTQDIYDKNILKNYYKRQWISLISIFYNEVSVLLSEGSDEVDKYKTLIKKYFIKKESKYNEK